MEAKENGCICDKCAELGVECDDVAEDGNDECSLCIIGVHGKRRAEIARGIRINESKEAAIKLYRERGQNGN